ncbi:MAG: hypothetical protein ACE5G2_10775 [Candidatus Krumholzibacteriia bacterium]
MQTDARRFSPRIAALLLGALLWQATTALASQEPPATARIWGSVGFGQRFIDETGARNLFTERSHRFDGFGFHDLSLHARTPQGLQLDIEAPRVDDLGHDVRFGVRSPFVKGSLRSVSSRFFHDADGGLRSRRQHLSADLRVRPTHRVELFGNHSRIDRSGARQAILPGDEGELGTVYDHEVSSWRGGVRLFGLGSTLQVGFLGRELRSLVRPEFDRSTRGVDVQLRSQPLDAVRAQALYARAVTQLDRDDTELASARFSGRLDFRVRPGWSLGPRLRYEESTDEALGFTAQIWTVGAGARRQGTRWSACLDGEWGARDNANGSVDVWGVDGSGWLDLTHGWRLDLRLRRSERQTFEGPLPDDVTSIAGAVETQRLQTRLRYRPTKRWRAELLVARLDRDYDDVGVEQQTWRYGLQATVSPRPILRLEAGWRLDDAFDARSTGRYDLRTHMFFAGVQLDLDSRLRLRTRIDLLDMQRSVDVRKTFVTGGLDYEVGHDLTVGVQYERDEYEDGNPVAGTYDADMLLLTLRQGFSL